MAADFVAADFTLLGRLVRLKDEVQAERIALAETTARLNAETVMLQQGAIRELEAEIARLKRGEFICRHCGLRKDAESEHAEF